MSENKSILIITDDSDETGNTAKKIASSIDKLLDKLPDGLNGSKVLVKAASGFVGTDLLPANIIFIGCEEPSPPCFSYFEEMLQHINLAGRSCGIFSSSKKAVQYLSKLVKDSDISIKAEPLLVDNSSDISEWAARVIG